MNQFLHFFLHLFCSQILHLFWRKKNNGRRHGSNVNSTDIHQFLSKSYILCSVFKVSVRKYYYLIRLTLVIAFGFFSKILGGYRDLQMVLCHSMNAGSVVGIPLGGGNTQTLPFAKEFVWTFYTQRQGCKNLWAWVFIPSFTPLFSLHLCSHLETISYLVEYPLPNIYQC